MVLKQYSFYLISWNLLIEIFYCETILHFIILVLYIATMFSYFNFIFVYNT